MLVGLLAFIGTANDLGDWNKMVNVTVYLIDKSAYGHIFIQNEFAFIYTIVGIPILACAFRNNDCRGNGLSESERFPL